MTHLTLGLCALGSVACSGEGDFEERTGRHSESIINGTLDTSHDAVVFLAGQQSGCTGTILTVTGASAFILTAAHCFDNGAIQAALIGPDYQFASDYLQVTAYEVHPQYDASPTANPKWDFAMIRAAGAGPTTPSILPMAPIEETMQAGTQIDHYGYGITGSSTQNTRRYHTTNTIDQVGIVEFAYAQPNSGPCSGDSGGPGIITTPDGERVAGVISRGDQNCNQFGVSGKVSTVYDSFILPFIEDSGGSLQPPQDPTTTSSSTGATSTAATSGAGGATTTTVGAGAGPVDDAWIAGSAENKEYEGIIVESGCSASGRGDAPAPWWLALGPLGWIAARRRRRP